MTINFSTKRENTDLTSLYCLIGEAVCEIQHLESALSILITLKKDVKYPPKILKKEADTLLEKYRSYTLGQAIKLAKKNNLYSDTLYSELAAFLKERNWLIHKLVSFKLDGIHPVLVKIKAITSKAKMLQQTIEADLIEFGESSGKNMSTRTHINQYFH